MEAERFGAYDIDIPVMNIKSGFFSQYYADVPGGARMITHYHRIIELMLVMKGTVAISVEGEVWPMKEGDIAIVQPGLMHRTLIYTPEKDYVRHVLHVSPDFVHHLEEQQNLPPHTLDYLLRNGIIHCSREDTAFASQLLKRLYDVELKNPGDKADFTERRFIRVKDEQGNTTPPYVYACCLLVEFLLYFSMKEKDNAITPITNPLIERVIPYINENYRDTDLSLEKLAAEMYVSQGYLCRVFKKYTGGSPYNYIMQKRLACAQALLCQGKSVLDACVQSGFGDYSSFLKAFRALYNCTPREYAARIKNGGSVINI